LLSSFILILYLCASVKGPVAERLGSALQKLLLRFESGRDLEKVNPLKTNNFRGFFHKITFYLEYSSAINPAMAILISP
jgi:hypothetical protein